MDLTVVAVSGNSGSVLGSRMVALRQCFGEESPGSMETRCRVTPGGGNPRESATENIPPQENGYVW